MYCRNCGKEISENAKFCDGCGKSVTNADIVTEKPEKKKKKRHPILGTIVLIFGILVIIGALSGGSDDPKKVDATTPEASANAEKTVPAIFTVGDTLEMGGVVVTLNDVSESKGSQFLKPADGNVFVVCEFTIENNTKSEIAVSSMMSFEAYFDDYAANLSISAMTADQSKQQLDGAIAAGKKINGVVGYEVPEDWSEMEVKFSANAFASKDFTFTYSK